MIRKRDKNSNDPNDSNDQDKIDQETGGRK